MPKQYNRKDHYYKKAKEEGYRSRAAYKLLELQKKHKIIKPGNSVLDLGCFPGGWLQVAGKIAGKKGLVVGVDLKDIEDTHNESGNIFFIKGDLSEEETKSNIKSINKDRFDVIVSDMSPHLTGIKFRDQVAAAELFDLAILYCDEFLKKGGMFIAKIFPSEETEAIFRNNKHKWEKLSRTNLSTSRSSSTELYAIGTSYIPPTK